MTAPLDFPANPTYGQDYTGPNGLVYTWDGNAWTIGFYNTESEALYTVGDLIEQIRTLLQDVDLSGGEYRYSTDSLVLNINQGLVEMYRIRPDIFLERKFKIPVLNSTDLGATIGIEQQYLPSLVYYAVGMAQLRDDEPTQDNRASSFLAKFTSTLVAVA